jgi:hypothetical protein
VSSPVSITKTRWRGISFFRVFDHLDAVHFGHVIIDDDDANIVLTDQSTTCLTNVFAIEALEVPERQRVANLLANRRIVVNDEHTACSLI